MSAGGCCAMRPGTPGRAGLRARVLAGAAVATTIAVAAPSAWACTLPAAGRPLGAGPVQLAWQAAPGPITVGRPFALQVFVCPEQARLQRVDATMPEHRHGMNYRPSVRAAGAGRWQVDGLLWHMAGSWELRFDVVAADGTTQVLRQRVELR